MNLSALSIIELGKIINADEVSKYYLSLPKLIEFFNMHGASDSYQIMQEQSKVPSRKEYTKNKLINLNGSPVLKEIIESLVDDRRCEDSDLRASDINKIIKHDNYSLEKNTEGIYIIKGKDLPENIKVTPVFEDIENQVIQHIKSADYSIWVAVAWITSRPILEALYRQHLKGINVRIVVNDDETTAEYGLPIENTGIEYYKVSPQNLNFKNTMHHKFCVIDLRKVITGSFNWTNRASFNDENITVLEQREKAEMFASEFLKLILPFKSKRKGH